MLYESPQFNLGKLTSGVDLSFADPASGVEGIATAFNDNIAGTAFHDGLRGGLGGDRISGNNGADVLQGGDGDDVLSGNYGADRLEGGIGGDKLDGGLDDDLLFGGDGRDQLIGGEGDDNLTGGAGNDRLSGGDGANRLEGGDGDDRVSGGLGNETLSGGSGNDILTAGAGIDRLKGGTGTDRFIYSDTPGEDADTITDFTPSVDLLVFDAEEIGQYGRGDGGLGRLDPVYFQSGKADTAQSGTSVIIYDTDTGNLFIDADANGGLFKPILLLTLKESPQLSAGDILFV